MCRKLPFEIKDFVRVSGTCCRQGFCCTDAAEDFLLFVFPEIRVSADAVSLPGPEVLSDAEEPQAEIPVGDEDERISL